MAEQEKGIGQRISEAIRQHRAGHHGAKSVKPWMLSAVVLPSYTDATRPSASSVDPGTVIYNSDDHGLNVSDGTSWRAPSGGWVVT